MNTQNKRLVAAALASATAASGATFFFAPDPDPEVIVKQATRTQYEVVVEKLPVIERIEVPVIQTEVIERYIEVPVEVEKIVEVPVEVIRTVEVEVVPENNRPTCYEDSVLMWDGATDAHTNCVPLDDLIQP